MAATVRIRDQLWTIVVSKRMPRKYAGLCEYARKRIRVKAGMTLPETLATAIHEAVHATLPELEEADVAAVEAACMDVIKVVMGVSG